MKYPKFLSFSKSPHLNKENKINFFNLIENKFNYKNQLKLINSFNLNPSGFLKKPLFTSITLKNQEIINIVKKNKKIKQISSGLVDDSFYPITNITTYNTRRFILNFININISKVRYGLIRFYINGGYNEKLAKNFKKLQCLFVNFNKTQKIKVPVEYYLLNNNLFFVLNLKNINLKNVNKIIISFKQKQITIPYSYNFQINKNIYLIHYTITQTPSLDNIIKNDPLFKLNNKKIYLKNYALSLKTIDEIFKNGGSFISHKIYLKQGNYNIAKVPNEIFKIKIASLEKIKHNKINYAKKSNLNKTNKIKPGKKIKQK